MSPSHVLRATTRSLDLGESFPTSIYLQKSASIQPSTSPSKFGEKFNSLFTSILSYMSTQMPRRDATTRYHPRDAVLSILQKENARKPKHACWNHYENQRLIFVQIENAPKRSVTLQVCRSFAMQLRRIPTLPWPANSIRKCVWTLKHLLGLKD